MRGRAVGTGRTRPRPGERVWAHTQHPLRGPRRSRAPPPLHLGPQVQAAEAAEYSSAEGHRGADRQAYLCCCWLVLARRISSLCYTQRTHTSEGRGRA